MATVIEFFHSNAADIILIWISTGLGFFSAMSVDFITKHRRNKQENIVMIKQLLKELESVQDFLDSNKTTTDKDMKYYISPYSLAAWNVSIQTGKIADIIKYECYTKVIETFNQISEANQIETIIYQKIFDLKTENKNRQTESCQQQAIRDNYIDYLKEVREKTKWKYSRMY